MSHLAALGKRSLTWVGASPAISPASPTRSRPRWATSRRTWRRRAAARAAAAAGTVQYPVPRAAHPPAARRYFNQPPNRGKYTPEEQAYIDKKINEALERFGVAVKIKGGAIEDEAGTIQADVPMNKDIDKMTF